MTRPPATITALYSAELPLNHGQKTVIFSHPQHPWTEVEKAFCGPLSAIIPVRKKTAWTGGENASPENLRAQKHGEQDLEEKFFVKVVCSRINVGEGRPKLMPLERSHRRGVYRKENSTEAFYEIARTLIFPNDK